jgi:ketosteroid isomerase-like protein
LRDLTTRRPSGIEQEKIMNANAAVRSSAVTSAEIKRAIETRDAKALSGFYADDALLRVIDCNNPPSRPREVRGKAAISTFWDDICSRAMTHAVETSIADSNRLAFSQACAYPDGMKVFCLAMCDLKGGKIARQTVVQAWDA